MSPNNWERHKATILNLYCRENMPIDEIISYMKEIHNFVRSKRSYENQLARQWGIRKNLRKEHWQYLACQMKRRQGKPTEVTVYGTVLSQQKLHKELQRYTPIPTAQQFGNEVSSPEMPEDMIVRIQTPPIIGLGDSWPNSLPWFLFKNSVLPEIRFPSDFLRAFFNTPFSTPLRNEKSGLELHNYIAWTNPLELRQAVICLSSTVPDDSIDKQEKQRSLARNEFPPCLVAEMLKIIFFRLANKMDNLFVSSDQILYDKIILHLVKVVEGNSPEIALTLFSGTCATAMAIKESIYGSAIREGHHDLARLLLQPKSGVDPDLLVEPPCLLDPWYNFQRGKISLQWYAELERVTGMQVAAATLDTRLGEILLSAGAAINKDEDCLLELAACASELAGNDEDAIDFLRLLVDQGVTVDAFTKSCECGPRVSLVFALAISSKNHRLVEFLIEKGATANTFKHSEIRPCHCGGFGHWYDAELDSLKLTYTPLQLAIISGNQEMTERLLQPIFSHPTQASPKMIKKLLLLSCLVGDTTTALRLSKLEDIHVDRDMEWPNTAAPLILSAWNPDTTIAKALLDLGASVGPKVGTNIRHVSKICPIHAAARYGNANLVRLLIIFGADLDVHYKYVPGQSTHREYYSYGEFSCPLQFGLNSQDAETIQLLLSHLNLPGVDPEDHGFISAFSSHEEGSGGQLSGLESAVKLGNKGIISHYLSSGDPYLSHALYLATQIAVKSKDYSILKLLVEHRPTRQIDSFEASSLVLSIAESRLDLISLFLSHPFLASSARSYSIDLERYKHFSIAHQSNDHGQGLTPLSAAFLSGDILIVKAMIRRGFIPQPSDAVALFEGSIENHEILGIIRMEMLHKFPLTRMDPSCRAAVLVQAIRSGDVKKVRRSMTLLPPLNISYFSPEEGLFESRQLSPLRLAVTTGNLELVTILLDAGADPYDLATKSTSETALVAAADAGYLNIVQCLLDRMKVVDSSYHRRVKSLALIKAASHGYLSIAKCLIEKGADINELPYLGCTPLETAAIRGKLDMVQLLLERGAYIEKVKRISYVQSVSSATKNGHFAVAAHLKRYGSWGERDQQIYDNLSVLNPEWYYSYTGYDEANEVWYFRDPDGDGEIPFPPRAQTASEGGNIQCPMSLVGHASSDVDYVLHNELEEGATHILQTRQSIMDSPPAGPSYPNFAIAKMTNSHLTSPRAIRGAQNFPKADKAAYESELSESLEIKYAIPTSETSYDSVSVSRGNEGAAKDIDVFWGQSEDSPETLPIFNRDTSMPELTCPSERVVCFDSTESEGEGLADAVQLDEMGDLFGGFDFDMLEMDVAGGQGVMLSSEDKEFVGPFTTNAIEIGDVNDVL